MLFQLTNYIINLLIVCRTQPIELLKASGHADFFDNVSDITSQHIPELPNES